MSSENERKPDEGPPAEVPTPTPPIVEPVELVPAEQNITAKRKPGGNLSLDDFILLNEEIAGMARAGLPLDQGLKAMAREMGNGRLRIMMNQVAGDLHHGLTLPEAIERQAGRVPPYYSSLLTAGIRTQRIGEVISTLTAYARTMADLRTTIINAMVYPVIVLVLCFMLFGGMSYFVVPLYKSIFLSFKMQLPLFTRLVLDFHEQRFWFFVVLPLVLIGGFFALRFFARRNPGRWRIWARFWYSVPILGELLRSARLASFCDLLGILVDNSVPLPEAFALAGQASSDPLTALGAQQVHDELRQGTPLGPILRSQKLMPEMVAWMVGLGEIRGTLGPTLHQVAEMYRRRVEMRSGLLRNLLPAFLIVFFVGVVIALHVIAMFLPMIMLIEQLSTGGKVR